MTLSYYEFFAGGGMARAGVGSHWTCHMFANDIDPKKALNYAANWGEQQVVVRGNVAHLKLSGVLKPSQTSSWALSVSLPGSFFGGMGAGANGDRSGTFWPFWDLS